MTRSAYVQVRCAVVALWSERHQRYAAKTGPETSNLTQNYGFAGSSFLDDRRHQSSAVPRRTNTACGFLAHRVRPPFRDRSHGLNRQRHCIPGRHP